MDAQPLLSRAPAKINLTLHIERRRPDGWHELVSLVAFAGVGDHVWLLPGDRLSLDVAGAASTQIGPDDENLVLKAARNLFAHVENLQSGRFRLLKRLPVASGMGGGSSDAAAALRLLARANDLPLDDARVIAAARCTGADVPVCLAAYPCVMEGVGERLGPRVNLPRLFAVLVNPRVALETGRVFKRLGLPPGSPRPAAGEHPAFGHALSYPALLELLRGARNDMEDAACGLLPVIGEQLARLSGARGCRLARMSGSGATCFGLFDDRHAAAAAAQSIRSARPRWWVKPTVLR